MFLSKRVISEAIQILKNIHPFYGNTFLACKRENLPVGRVTPILMSEIEDDLIRSFYQTDRNSDYFYTAFFTSAKKDRWNDLASYAESTLQSTRTRSRFRDAFLHEPGSSEWGWNVDYVSILEGHLSQNKGQKYKHLLTNSSG